MNKINYLTIITLCTFVFLGCGKDNYPTDINTASTATLDSSTTDITGTAIMENTDSFCLNTDYITSNPLIVDADTEMSSEISDWIICENYENVEIAIKKSNSERILAKLPEYYYPISSPYKITFTNTVTNETLCVEVQSVGGGIPPEDYDVTADPYYNPVGDDEINFEPELYNENENYFYCSNLSVLTEHEGFLPALAIADFANQVGQFILSIADAGNWEKPESCYVLESTIEQTDYYSRFHIYINPNQNLEIQVTYYYDTGYEFIIVQT